METHPLQTPVQTCQLYLSSVCVTFFVLQYNMALIGHASMSACLYTWSQNPLSLVLFAPPLSCFGTITLHSCAAWYFMVDCHKNLQMTTTHKAICCIVDSFVYIFNSYSYQLNQHCDRVIIIHLTICSIAHRPTNLVKMQMQYAICWSTGVLV